MRGTIWSIAGQVASRATCHAAVNSPTRSRVAPLERSAPLRGTYLPGRAHEDPGDLAVTFGRLPSLLPAPPEGESQTPCDGVMMAPQGCPACISTSAAPSPTLCSSHASFLPVPPAHRALSCHSRLPACLSSSLPLLMPVYFPTRTGTASSQLKVQALSLNLHSAAS